eukprot:TRINITY_DN408_c0_g1_i6.p1 TRINITY_DN408_c0_g1~~TRINITY_DN408_c0_g1_i6.p1  ORF type:complete len:254 (-),score=67.03 TRINITY_DN408_c0_g1_i6:171-932(-)
MCIRDRYKYEVKKHQDRSTPLLGDSWDIDPALKGSSGIVSSDLRSDTGFASSQTASLHEDDLVQADAPPLCQFRISADELTLEQAEDTYKQCKKVLDQIWTQMSAPPAAVMSKKELRETMREQRQNLLPQEKSTKRLCDQLKELVRLFQDAQKGESDDADNVQAMQGTESQEQKVFRGNDRVRKALADIPVHVITEETLLDTVDVPLVTQLKHALGQSSKDAAPSPESEKQGWNRSTFVDKRGSSRPTLGTDR